jgi:hypothetical protein
MAVERAGVPAVVNVCEGFIPQAKETASMGGLPWLNIVNYPGHIDLYTLEERDKYISELVAPGNVKALTTPIPAAAAVAKAEPPETAITFKGTWEDVLTHYREKMWSDGLPIIPPTVERVKEFLKYTDYPADAILTRPVAPSYRQATTWTVAVNGVMAGCRPEYMPILVAMTKAWGDKIYEAENSSSTPGWAPITFVNGPIKKQLGINYGHSYGTPGLVANTSMGRFWTMYKRNVLQIVLEATDMATHGRNFFNLAGEDDELCKKFGWKTIAEEFGFNHGDNVVMTMSCRTHSQACPINGSTAEEVMDRIAGQIAEAGCCQQGLYDCWYVFVIPALVGQVIAKDRWSKDRMRDYLYKNARHTARFLETRVQTDMTGWYAQQVKSGKLPKMFAESDDPNRLVPIFIDPGKLYFVLGGDEARNRVCFYMNNQNQGHPHAVKIELPKNWDALLKNSQLKKDMAKAGRNIAGNICL